MSSDDSAHRAKSLDAEARQHPRRPVGGEGFHPRRRQGRGHGGRPGRAREGSRVTGKMRSLAEYRDQMREIVKQGLVDIMLMSASTSELLTIRERLFENSHVTPAVRANDTTDIHLLAGGTYARRAFAAVSLGHDRADSERQGEPDRGRAAARGGPGALLDHAEQPARVRLRHARGVQAVPHRGRGEGLPPLPGSLRPQRLRRRLPGRPGPVHQRPDRPHAGRRSQQRPAGVPEDRLPRPQGDGGTGRLRPAPRPRHPRRLQRHHATTRSSCWKRRRSTAPGPPCSAGRSTTASTSSRSSRYLHAIADGQDRRGRGGARRITATWRS